jgi:anti-sigma28 factor (negative regulator of flagellin synthesis)
MAALSRTVRMACALSGRDDIRTEKILAIQQAIATGKYNIATSAVADKLMCTLLK